MNKITPLKSSEKEVHTEPKKSKLIVSAKNLFLTYSNCKLELEEVVIQLKSILSSSIVKEYVLVREYHVSGEPHIHVYFNVKDYLHDKNNRK